MRVTHIGRGIGRTRGEGALRVHISKAEELAATAGCTAAAARGAPSGELLIVTLAGILHDYKMIMRMICLDTPCGCSEYCSAVALPCECIRCPRVSLSCSCAAECSTSR